jgi:hypothetical protein
MYDIPYIADTLFLLDEPTGKVKPGEQYCLSSLPPIAKGITLNEVYFIF